MPGKTTPMGRLLSSREYQRTVAACDIAKGSKASYSVKNALDACQVPLGCATLHVWKKSYNRMPSLLYLFMGARSLLDLCAPL